MPAFQRLGACRRAACGLILAAGALAGSALAMQQGATALGGSYATGGVSEDEQALLRSQRDKYSLWIVTAARKSGAYLADVRVRVTDSSDRVVFDNQLDGPWLLLDLPRGRYVIEARLDRSVQRRAVSVGSGGRSQVVFHFDAGVDTLRPSPEERLGREAPGTLR